MRARRMTIVYAALAAIGTILPLVPFVGWLRTNGFDPLRFAVDLFANGVSSFFAIDLAIAAVVVTLFVIVQGAREGVRRRWLPIAATWLIGVSCGLPLFLAMREAARARAA